MLRFANKALFGAGGRTDRKGRVFDDRTTDCRRRASGEDVPGEHPQGSPELLRCGCNRLPARELRWNWLGRIRLDEPRHLLQQVAGAVGWADLPEPHAPGQDGRHCV